MECFLMENLTMPKMTINVDTDAKTLDITLNGNKISNIYGVNIYKSYCEEDEYRVSLMTSQEVDGVRTEVSYSLECEVEEAMAGKISAAAIDGFAPTSSTNEIHKQIQKWLKNG